MSTNLPSFEIQDSAAGTKLYFDTYGEAALEFAANDVTAAVSFSLVQVLTQMQLPLWP